MRSMMNVRAASCICAATLGLSMCFSQVNAQTYPEKPLRLVVPFAAGAAADMVGRLIAQKLSEAWGFQVLVDNRARRTAVLRYNCARRGRHCLR